MKRIFHYVLLLTLTILTPINSAHAGEISVETDPSTFFLKGYAAHVFYQPDDNKLLRIGAGTYSLELPDFMVNLDSQNKHHGWTAKINSSVAFFLEYNLSENRSTSFVGLQLAQQNYRVSNQGGGSDFSNALAMLSFCYRWYVTDHFYLKPWMGVGYQRKFSGDNCVAGQCYHVSPIMGFATFHAGYSF
jgi:hypothetical protein